MPDKVASEALLRGSFKQRYAGDQARIFDVPRRRFPRDRYQSALKLLRGGERVLDVGCGDGLLLYNLRDRYRDLVGVDFLAERTDAAQRALAARSVKATVVAAALENGLPWDDGHFDPVVWTDVIQFAPDLFGAMREIARVMRPGGQLVTTAPNLGYVRRIVDLLLGRFPATSALDQGFAVRDGTWYDDGTFHYFTFGSLAKLYDHMGFDVDRMIGHGRLGVVHAVYPRLLSGGIAMSGTKRSVQR